MKILHTADWHLGKLVQSVYMTADQRHILNQFIEHVDIEKPDAIIIAGDLYDRSIPPTEAIQLLDDTLQKIVIERGIPVLAIAGNHDSASRIDFATSLMTQSGLYMVGKWTPDSEPVCLQDDEGEVYFWLIPFMDPSEVRYVLNDDSIRTHQQAMEAIMASITPKMKADARHVFVGHAFVTKGGVEEEKDSEGERPLAIGGSECIDAALFDAFDYAAFGHLHGAHFVGKETIRYAGSPLKYSISEEHHKKGYLVVELSTEQATITKKELQPLRDMRRIKAYTADILASEPSDDYVFVTLLDEQPILSPMEKIRGIYKNAMHVERQTIVHVNDKQQTTSRRQMDDVALFKAFYAEMLPGDIPDDTLSLFNELLAEQLQNEREGGNYECNR